MNSSILNLKWTIKTSLWELLKDTMMFCYLVDSMVPTITLWLNTPSIYIMEERSIQIPVPVLKTL